MLKKFITTLIYILACALLLAAMLAIVYIGIAMIANLALS